jgi:cell shape-determining protein MreC|tara:strand:+ start:172 stop:480 length:309 start_codon:yes stop_codon:yes gene_type:complete
MGVFKGKPNLLGKPKGAINQTTKVAKEFILKIVNDNLETIQKDFKQLSERDRIKLTIELMNFVVPKLKQIEATVENSYSDNTELLSKLMQIPDANFKNLLDD